MAFTDLAPMTGRALWVGLDVSFDNFATVSYRWATQAAKANTFQYSRKIVAMGNLKRGLESNNFPAASTVSLAIDNTDFAADWLVNRTTVATQVLKARFKLHVGLTSDVDQGSQPELLTKVVGVFVCMDYPRRNEKAIQLNLGDDIVGLLSEVLIAPTFMDWFYDAGTTTTNAPFGPSFFSGEEFEPVPLVDLNIPSAIQFGYNDFVCPPTCYMEGYRTPLDFDVAGGFGAGRRASTYPIVVLATRNLDAFTSDNVRSISGRFRKDVVSFDTTGELNVLAGKTIYIPETYVVAGDELRIWKAYKTQTISKNGYDWKLLWIAFDVIEYQSWFVGAFASNVNGKVVNAPIPANPKFKQKYESDPSLVGEVPFFTAFENFLVRGSPGSGVYAGASGSNPGSAVLILKDMAEYYSELGVGSTSATHFTRAALTQTNDLFRGDIVATGQGLDASVAASDLPGRTSPYSANALRKAIIELSGSADLDVFITYDGKVALVAQGADFETSTTTFPTFSETRIGNVEDRIPSAGERWSPYNRVLIQTKEGILGPYDSQDGMDEWGKVLTKMLQAKWWAKPNLLWGGDLTNSMVWQMRKVEAKVRPIISFTTDMSFVVFELGDYFLMAWSRGGSNTAHALTCWRLESITIVPSTGMCEVTAVWMEDLRTDYPYLLDNEALVVRATHGAETLTVTDTSSTITRSAGSFITDGVAPGDIILIRDTSEDFWTFFRNRQLRVQSVTDALNLVITEVAPDFGTAGAHVIATGNWTMYRGATTYPSAITDAANYPSGGLMYGKVSKIVSGSGAFSDTSAANKLLDG